jgi:hypothetical protein
MSRLTKAFLSALILPGILFGQQPQKSPKIDFESGEAIADTAEKPATTGDEKLDPETQRLIQEAREKIIKERAEKLAAEKKAAEDAARQKEAEKLKSQKKSESRVYFGVTGMLGIPLNSFVSTGYAFGATLDAIIAERFGLHFALSTGSFSTKASTLKAGNSTLNVKAGESIGYLEFDTAFSYVFPRFLNIETSLGGGLMVHQLGAKAFGLGSQASPMIFASAFIPLLSYIDVGILNKVAFPQASNINSGNGNYTLDEKQSLTALSVFISVRLLFH